jgi:hypothetical protein
MSATSAEPVLAPWYLVPFPLNVNLVKCSVSSVLHVDLAKILRRCIAVHFQQRQAAVAKPGAVRGPQQNPFSAFLLLQVRWAWT